MYYHGRKTRERIVGNDTTVLCNSTAMACAQIPTMSDLLGSDLEGVILKCSDAERAALNKFAPMELRFTHNQKDVEPRSGSSKGWIHRLELDDVLKDKLVVSEEGTIGDVIYPSRVGVEDTVLPVNIQWSSKYCAKLEVSEDRVTHHVDEEVSEEGKVKKS